MSTLKYLTEGFLNGLEKPTEHKYFHLYYYFWQRYLWALGGFILKYIEEQEFKTLYKKTGVTIEEIPNSFK